MCEGDATGRGKAGGIREAVNSDDKTEKVCAFCDKRKDEVAQLIARSDKDLAICDECIGMSVDILLKHLKRPRLGSTKDDIESKLGTLRMEVKLLRQGKGWAEERATKAETALREARKHLQWIAQQPCTMDAEMASDDTLCTETGACITEFCLSCYAKVALRKPDESED